MQTSTGLSRRLLIMLALVIFSGGHRPVWADSIPSVHMRESIVKIYVTILRQDYAQPWQAAGIANGNGTGFIIERRRILTNAHVVSDASFIEVQREGDPERYAATVEFIGHDCDLAILKINNPIFFKNTQPLALGSQLPELNDEVIVLGYPMGGSRISLTRGVVSRIDYSPYSHSAADAHLVMQVDAAINPGNSGGPVIFADKVVGLAFQGIMESQNIGYAIPLPVIHHFLEDISDGVYQGYPELGIGWLEARNPALRHNLKLSDQQTGVVVNFIDPYGSANGYLKTGDVLLKIDGYLLANDGTIALDGNTVEFTELMERRQWGARITCDIWRQGAALRCSIPLENPQDPFCFRRLYDQQPEYLMTQGLVFAPLTLNLLTAEADKVNSRQAQALLYYLHFAKLDGLHVNRAQFIVLAGRLAHPINTYLQDFVYGIVVEANQRPIGSLSDLQEALQHPEKGFHVIRFEGSSRLLVLNAALSEQADREICQKYRVPALAHIARQP